MSRRPAWLLKMASLEMAVTSLALLMALIFLGTIAQARIGTFAAQQIYFNRFFVWSDFGGRRLPIFPGGLIVGALWLANLTAAFIVRFRPRRRSIGIFISHAGLIVLLLGQFLTQRLAQESQMPIEVGQTLAYSEDARKTELVFTRSLDDKLDEAVAIPAKILMKPGSLVAPQLPFQIIVRNYFPNADLGMIQGDETPAATQGVGARIVARGAPESLDDDAVNNATAIVEIVDGGKTLGTWLASTALGARQTFVAAGQDYEIALRPKRIHYPFHLTLKEFHHDIYPGTDVPKNFSSLVHISNPAQGDDRDTLIYMNHPLRYEGKTFYQSSFGKNDTLSVFQVVENPFWLTPYISCAMVVLGLAIQFLQHLLTFLKRRA